MKPFRALESILAVGVAGLLWLLASVPVVTVGPATAGLFGVFATWEPGQEAPPVWSTFWSRFRQHFRQGLGFGLGLVVVGLLLFVDAWYGMSAEDAPLRPVVLAAAIFGTVLLLGTLVYLFPVLVTYPAPWRRTLRNAALFAAGYVWTTLLGLFCWVVAGLAIFWSPLLVPFAVATAAFVVSRLTGRTFERYLVKYGGDDTGAETDSTTGSETETEAETDAGSPHRPEPA